MSKNVKTLHRFYIKHISDLQIVAIMKSDYVKIQGEYLL